MPDLRPARLPARGEALVPHLYRDLRERIVSGALAPGEAVSESRIAEGYGVSRTPIREAFKKLAEDGFLDVVPQVGSFVARIDLKVVRDNLGHANISTTSIYLHSEDDARHDATSTVHHVGWHTP